MERWLDLLVCNSCVILETFFEKIGDFMFDVLFDGNKWMNEWMNDKFLDHMLVKFEQNRMVRTIQNFELWQKWLTMHFWPSVDAILQDVSVTETIVWS